MELKEVKVVIEALLLASDVPLSEKKISSILDNNLDTLGIIGLEDKYDALAVIYEMTDQLYKDVNGET